MMLCEAIEQEVPKKCRVIGVKVGMKPAAGQLQWLTLFWVCRHVKNRNNCPKSGSAV